MCIILLLYSKLSVVCKSVSLEMTVGGTMENSIYLYTHIHGTFTKVESCCKKCVCERQCYVRRCLVMSPTAAWHTAPTEVGLEKGLTVWMSSYSAP